MSLVDWALVLVEVQSQSAVLVCRLDDFPTKRGLATERGPVLDFDQNCTASAAQENTQATEGARRS